MNNFFVSLIVAKNTVLAAAIISKHCTTLESCAASECTPESTAVGIHARSLSKDSALKRSYSRQFEAKFNLNSAAVWNHRAQVQEILDLGRPCPSQCLIGLCLSAIFA